MNAPADFGAAFKAVIAQEVERCAGELKRPEFVSQRTCEALLGLPKDVFLDLAKQGRFASTKERRLIIARYADVAEALAARMRRRAANDVCADGEERALARVGARRVAP